LLRIAAAQQRSQDRRQAKIRNKSKSKHETPTKAAATFGILLPMWPGGQCRLIDAGRCDVAKPWRSARRNSFGKIGYGGKAD
jgi:hypothetical protein